MKLKFLVLLFLLSIFTISKPLVPIVKAATETRYMDGEQHTINGKLARKLLSTELQWNGAFSKEGANLTCYLGMRIWVRHENESETELTDGVSAIVERQASSDYTIAMEQASWNCSEKSLEKNDAVLVAVYGQIEGYDWQLFGASPTYSFFITEQLKKDKLDSTVWVVHYSMLTWSAAGDTHVGFYCGTEEYNSRIENFASSEQQEGGAAGGPEPTPPWWQVKWTEIKQLLETKVKSPVWNLWTQFKVSFEGVVSSVIILLVVYYVGKFVYNLLFKSKKKWKVYVRERW